MPRTDGYAPRGQRCPGQHDWNAKGRVNVIEALPAGVLLCVGLTEANVNADIFNLWLEHDLIKAAGHTLEYLPPYSPDFNDIEHKWAQARACRRKTGKTTGEIFKDTTWNQN